MRSERRRGSERDADIMVAMTRGRTAASPAPDTPGDLTLKEMLSENSRTKPRAAGPLRWHIYDRQRRCWRWVIVEDGNFKGWFGWVPRYLRVGPWSPIAALSVAGWFSLAYAYKPSPLEFHVTLPQLYSRWWGVELLTFVWTMCINSILVRSEGRASFFTYTMWHWVFLTLRSGWAVLAPLIGAESHPLSWAWEALRGPVIMGHAITSIVWNLVLFPLIYTFAFRKRPGRDRFVGRCFAFPMFSIHVCNLPRAAACILSGGTA